MDKRRETSECARAEELLDKKVQGLALSSAEERFLRDHLAHCPVCGPLERALESIRYDSHQPPVPPLDEVTAHRLVAQAVARAEASRSADVPRLAPDSAQEGALESLAQSRPENPGRLRAVMGLAGFAVLLAVAFAVGFALWHPRVPEKSRTGKSVTGPSVEATFVALSGPVLLDHEAAAVGSELRQGQTITTGSGWAVVALGPNGYLGLGRRTSLSLSQRGVGLVALELRQGVLDVFVDPTGATKVVVEAGAVRLTILGTFVRTERHGDCARVSVLHGRVAVEGASGICQVAGGQVLDTCSERLESMSRQESLTLWQAQGRFHLLAASGGSLLEVRSSKGGTIVSLDGQVLGPSPLVALVRPGSRRLEVRDDSGRTLAEFLALRPGGRSRRYFDLGAMPPRPAETEGRLPPKGPREPEDTSRRTQGPQSRSKSRRPRAKVDASQQAEARWAALLQEAQALRGQKRWREAAAKYREVIAEYPHRKEAKVALVSLGYLELQHLGQPHKALRHFQGYLASGGGLAQEALWGVILCHRVLGQTKQEILAIQKFLSTYPDSVRAARARRWLSELLGETQTPPAPNHPEGRR